MICMGNNLRIPDNFLWHIFVLLNLIFFFFFANYESHARKFYTLRLLSQYIQLIHMHTIIDD